MKSIRRTLLVWLSVGLASGLVVAGALVYAQALEEASELFDYQLEHLAGSLPRQTFAPVAAAHLQESDDDIVIQMWNAVGERTFRSHARDDLPPQVDAGFSDVATKAGIWRVYATRIDDIVVQVAQPYSARRELAAQMALNTGAPLLLLFPFLGVVLWVTVGRGLADVRRVAADVQSRDAGALAPISERGLPSEIRPLTQALNDLLLRLERSMDAQRAFVADAAHELRTPLTAVKLQAQVAEWASEKHERKAAFADLSRGLDRAAHLVQQLLTLARQEGTPPQSGFERVDLCALARSVVAEYALPADALDIDIGVKAEPPAAVMGDADALRILLGNLIDNAIRHTPRKGCIDVAVCGGDDGLSVMVKDTGPGIPAEEIGRVFDRFYRVLGRGGGGSGLGLAIVKRIADSHGALVTLDNTPTGLLARVTFRSNEPRSGKSKTSS